MRVGNKGEETLVRTPIVPATHAKLRKGESAHSVMSTDISSFLLLSGLRAKVFVEYLAVGVVRLS